MDTLLQFLSNYTNVWIVNAILIVALATIAVLRRRDNKDFSPVFNRGYDIGWTNARTFATMRDELLGQAEDLERSNTIVLALWARGASIDECSTLTGLETDQVCLVLANANQLPADVLETIERQPQLPLENSDSMLRHLERDYPLLDQQLEEINVPDEKFQQALIDHFDRDRVPTTSEVMGTMPDASFDEHVSVYEDWREPQPSDGPDYHAEYQFWLDNRHTLKTKDQRTPLQLIRFDNSELYSD